MVKMVSSVMYILPQKNSLIKSEEQIHPKDTLNRKYGSKKSDTCKS